MSIENTKNMINALDKGDTVEAEKEDFVTYCKPQVKQNSN